MKILRKRSIAYLIDVIIFAVIYHFTLYRIIDKIPEFLIFLVICPLFFRDIVFRNASIGKMMMGISIYDKNWKKPSIWKLIKRSCLVITIGFIKHNIEMSTYGNKLAIIDWERDRIGTYVIDNSVYFEIKEKAEAMTGDFATNMSDLYNKYLREQYLDK